MTKSAWFAEKCKEQYVVGMGKGGAVQIDSQM